MSTDLRVVTYNIYGDRGHDAAAQVVRALRPDVLVVNETPKLPVVWRRACDRLAQGWQLRRAGGGRDAGSSMICVSDRVEVVAVATRGLRRPWLKPRRGLVSMQARVDGHDLGVVGVHLSLLADSRPVEVGEALVEAQRLHGTVVVAGDVNERPSGPAWQQLARAGFVDHSPHRGEQTFPSHRPDRRIDALLLQEAGARVVAHRVVRELPGHDERASLDLLSRASDHRPVLLDLQLG